MICKNCSNNIDDNVAFCPYCGTPTNSAQNNGQNPNVYYNPNTQQSNQNNSYNQQGTQQPAYQQANMNSAPANDKLVAGLLAIFLGSLGIHKFLSRLYKKCRYYASCVASYFWYRCFCYGSYRPY